MYNFKQLGKYKGATHSSRRRAAYHKKRRNFKGRIVGLGLFGLFNKK